jgi:hypothetical protein
MHQFRAGQQRIWTNDFLTVHTAECCGEQAKLTNEEGLLKGVSPPRMNFETPT